MTAAADRLRLQRALARHRDIDDWTVRLTTTRSAWRAWGDGDQAGSAERAAVTGELHRDQPGGRGSASFALAADGDAERTVADAMVRADDAIGPGWRTPSPAAPARVELADPAIELAPLTVTLDAIARELDGAARATATEISRAFAEVAVDEVELITRRGQRARWRATRVEVRADARTSVVRDAPTAPIVTQARRVGDLDLVGALRAARVALEDAGARRPDPGTYQVAMRARALLHGGNGLLEAVIAQADPGLDRQGLVRYQLGKPIADGATLSLDSDGALPFGWRSAPLGDHGEPVRRFPLVARGLAAGLGLDAREAALRGAQPNGGVRGLVVPAGDVGADELIAPDTLVVDELAWLEVERTTGWFRAAIAAGELWRPGTKNEQLPGGGEAMGHRGGWRVRGGFLRGDAIALLARARRSRELVETPVFRGPALWHLGPLTVD